LVFASTGVIGFDTVAVAVVRDPYLSCCTSGAAGTRGFPIKIAKAGTTIGVGSKSASCRGVTTLGLSEKRLKKE